MDDDIANDFFAVPEYVMVNKWGQVSQDIVLQKKNKQMILPIQ